MNLEKYIQHKLNNEVYHGVTEVECVHGRIDILLPTTIIELKEVSKYKHGVGQLLAYSTIYPNRNLLLILFGTKEDITKYKLQYTTYCSNHKIEVKVAIVDFTFDSLRF